MKVLSVLLLLGTTHLAAQVTSRTGNPGGDDRGQRLARVEGKMLNSASGMPVARVTVSLRTDDAAQASKYITTSDSEGGFLFDHVEPGRYKLCAEKPGFLQRCYGRATGKGTVLTLSEGQLMKELRFELTPQGVISGMVTDEAGEPMDRVSVVAMQWGYWQGKRLLRPSGGALTNDLGEYRIANLSPGSYYLATRRGSVMAGMLLVSIANAPSAAAPETPEEGCGITYYPSSLDPSGATAVQVVPGSELRSLDMQVRKVHVFRVSGQVVDGATGQPATEAKVALMPQTTGSVVGLGSLGGPWIPGGKFEVTGVLPGSYVLMAQVTRNSQTLYARQSLQVGDRNVTDMVVTIPRAVDIAGRLRVSGEDLQAQPQQQERQTPQQQALRMDGVRIVLAPAEGLGLGPLPEATPRADGSFVLRGVVPDKFRVHVWGAPPGWYLKSILMGGQESPDGTVDLTGGGAIEIMLATGAGEVAGTVVDADDKPAPGVEVTLVPEDPGKQGRIELFRIATSDQNGQFRFADVVPGSYEIFAWQELESGALQDPEFLRRIESKATSIRLSENERETVQLKATSVEDVARALGKLPNM